MNSVTPDEMSGVIFFKPVKLGDLVFLALQHREYGILMVPRDPPSDVGQTFQFVRLFSLLLPVNLGNSK